jgi:hypothetical protein
LVLLLRRRRGSGVPSTSVDPAALLSSSCQGADASATRRRTRRRTHTRAALFSSSQGARAGTCAREHAHDKAYARARIRAYMHAGAHRYTHVGMRTRTRRHAHQRSASASTLRARPRGLAAQTRVRPPTQTRTRARAGWTRRRARRTHRCTRTCAHTRYVHAHAQRRADARGGRTASSADMVKSLRVRTARHVDDTSSLPGPCRRHPLSAKGRHWTPPNHAEKYTFCRLEKKTVQGR